MKNLYKEINDNGFAIVNNIFTAAEVQHILAVFSNVDSNKSTFRRSDDLFAIRQFLKEIPQAQELIFNQKLKELIKFLFGENCFLAKSIYFDKPEKSNWFVFYHQDLTISVDKKTEIEGFGPYTVKQSQFAVQPPIAILKSNFTIRIHLDDTDENNGALKVIPRSHEKGIFRPETIDWAVEKEVGCNVRAGGLMIMKPLLLHSSSRTTNNQKRRVIHLEFSDQPLPSGLNWAEYLKIN